MKKLSKKAQTILTICLLIATLALFAVGGYILISRFGKSIAKIKLQTPKVEYQSNDSGKFLIADNNILASGYTFYICFDTKNANDIYEYVAFNTDKFYLDVSNIFTNAQDYYYYGKCLGEGKYQDSNFSQVYTLSNMHDLSTPNLALSGTMLSWTAVDNVKSYQVYDGNNVINTTTQTNYDFSSYINSTASVSFSFSIKALGKTNYYDSLKSNSVSYTKTFTLEQVSGLSFNEVTKTLSWNSVTNADSYHIVLSTGKECDSKTNSVNLSNLINGVGVYTFKVRAIGTGNFVSGEYSELASYTQTEKLNAVTNIKVVTLNDTQISVVWDAPENAQTYTIIVDGEVVYQAHSLTSYTLEKNSASVVQVVVNGYGYYESSNGVSIRIN